MLARRAQMRCGPCVRRVWMRRGRIAQPPRSRHERVLRRSLLCCRASLRCGGAGALLAQTARLLQLERIWSGCKLVLQGECTWKLMEPCIVSVFVQSPCIPSGFSSFVVTFPCRTSSGGRREGVDSISAAATVRNERPREATVQVEWANCYNRAKRARSCDARAKRAVWRNERAC